MGQTAVLSAHTAPPGRGQPRQVRRRRRHLLFTRDPPPPTGGQDAWGTHLAGPSRERRPPQLPTSGEGGGEGRRDAPAAVASWWLHHRYPAPLLSLCWSSSFRLQGCPLKHLHTNCRSHQAARPSRGCSWSLPGLLCTCRIYAPVSHSSVQYSSQFVTERSFFT